MHELSIALEILDIAEREARRVQARGVKTVRVRIGDLSGVEPGSLAFSFDAVKGEREMTRDAVLAITRVPARLHCRPCGREFTGEARSFLCPGCGGFDTRMLAGEEMSIDELEVED